MTGAVLSRPGSRLPLSRERILVGAVELIDESGLHGFSMRTLGNRLDVEAMALYPYVGSKEGLLDAIVAFVLSEVQPDADLHPEQDPRWQGFLARSAREIRRIALAHPEIFPLIATRPREAPWVRPPLRSLSWMESFLVTLGGFGFSDQARVHIYRAFASFLLGHLLLEVIALGVDSGPEPTGPDAVSELPADPLRHYPRLAVLKPQMTLDHSQQIFDDALDLLTSRIERQIAPAEPNG